jgi:hypothetical protein
LIFHERVVLAAPPQDRNTIENVWWSQTGSNRRPPACKAGALPTELWPLQKTEHGLIRKVRRLSSDIGRVGLPSRSSRAACTARLRPSGYGAAAFAALRERRLVGLGRFELPTSRLSSARSNQLSYKPVPGVSNQKTSNQKSKDLITEYRLLTSGLLVREERETETAGSRKWTSSRLRRCVLMFPRDPIETREAL